MRHTKSAFFIVFVLIAQLLRSFFFFFFNDTATTEIYTLSLHDALPICRAVRYGVHFHVQILQRRGGRRAGRRSEEHTSELQSQSNLVCRLLLEKKKKNNSKMQEIPQPPLHQHKARLPTSRASC